MAVTKTKKVQKAPVKKAIKTAAPKAKATKPAAKVTKATTASKKTATKVTAIKTPVKTTASKAVVAAKAPIKKVTTPVKEVKASKKVETAIATKPAVKATTVSVPAPVNKPVLPVRQSAMAPVAAQRPNSPFANTRAANQQQRQIITTAPKAPQNDNGGVNFKVGDAVVYPAHGVGVVENIETQTIAGMDIQLYAIRFEKDRMSLKIPVFKAKSSGLRKLCSTDRLKDAMKTLQGRAKIKRTMWSRRAQEYEMKINSGDPVSIAEVLRDLKRSNDDHEQSYSERQIYQSALERLAREVAAVQKITEIQAAEQLEKMLGRLAA
ncbi:MAG: CarD family transcriptional regulator [Alphaproteobacteria bacterium]|nr:CarD family transcriptional regulator [Alphaproteobacteria bacterium]